MSEKRKYDSTVARIAGNIASGERGRLFTNEAGHEAVARECVALARAIVKEVERTEPAPTPEASSR